jgi:hypothetical protein
MRPLAIDSRPDFKKPEEPMKFSNIQTHWLASLAILTAVGLPSYAVDGVVLINQNAALAGSVTPGDTPGFPVTISVSGSYRLSGNLVVPDSGTTAILVTTNDVTIDLNGFSIIGPTICVGFPVACSPLGSGIGVDSGFNGNIKVLNGNIRGMGLAVFLGSDTVAERIHAVSNGGSGIFADVVTSCSATHNGGTGIQAASVTNSTADFNNDSGIIATRLATNNTAHNNGSAGILASCPSTGRLK